MPLTTAERAQIDAALDLVTITSGFPPQPPVPTHPTPVPPATQPPTQPPVGGAKIEQHVANVKALHQEGGGNGRRGEWLALQYIGYMPAVYNGQGLEPLLIERAFGGNFNGYALWRDSISNLPGDNTAIRIEDEFPRLLAMVRAVELGS